MRTTPVEAIWLATSVVGFVVCIQNYRTYRDDFIKIRALDPTHGDTYRVNALLNTLRLIGMTCLLFVSIVSASLKSPVSEPWRMVTQIALTAAVWSITFIAIIIRRAVKRRS